MRYQMPGVVTVITGGSSGIGRATAVALARQGGSIVLGARNDAALTEVAAACERSGGKVVTSTVDISAEGGAQILLDRAMASFGRLDAWINNAAVSLFGRADEVPWADYEQVLRTNLFGFLLGARAALPIFRRQGHGLLINVASAVSCFGQPLTSAYVVSKWGIRGLGECLRMELQDCPNVHVCTVLPGSIDTPIFQNAGNYAGRAVRPLPPVLPPEEVARAILDLYRRPQREVFVGKVARLAALTHALLPSGFERFMGRTVRRKHFIHRPEPPSPGNLYEPRHDLASGGWRSAQQPRPALDAILAGLAVTAPVLALLAAWQIARRRPAP